MTSPDKFCFFCDHFILSETEAMKREKVLSQHNTSLPANMRGYCRASLEADAHILHLGNLVPLHEVRLGRPGFMQTPEEVLAQTPCRVLDNQGQPKFISLNTLSDPPAPESA